MATAEFSKFASILSAALSQHHLLGFEIAQLEFFTIILRKKLIKKKINAIYSLSIQEKMGSIKDINGRDLTEAEDIKKRWQEYIEELYKKDLHDQDNHDGVITHLEADILECEVKCTLESITTNKASEGDGIPVELFQILKLML